MGNNYLVGAVVFLILVAINFVVITKGSGRIAEVAARFTLDAMPGKQMAIDAELNAGIIDELKATERELRSRKKRISTPLRTGLASSYVETLLRRFLSRQSMFSAV